MRQRSCHRAAHLLAHLLAKHPVLAGSEVKRELNVPNLGGNLEKNRQKELGKELGRAKNWGRKNWGQAKLVGTRLAKNWGQAKLGERIGDRPKKRELGRQAEVGGQKNWGQAKLRKNWGQAKLGGKNWGQSVGDRPSRVSCTPASNLTSKRISLASRLRLTHSLRGKLVGESGSA